MPRIWTPEQRAAFGEKMAAKRAAKRAHGNSAPNPIATDVLPSPAKKPRAIPRPTPIPTISVKKVEYKVTDLISDLESIPLPDVSYSDCGLLLNALNVCSTAVAQARRQKQESLDAGTHRAPCKTCGRMIDISKSGGFQILTERDQFHMPINSYYCSQNCLLARNMPSHAKSTSREKRENQA
jgi:hypothetical protein